MESVCVPIVRDFPDRRRFRDCVRAARTKRSGLIRGRIADIAEAFARAGVIEPDWVGLKANCFKKIQRSDDDAFHCLHGLLKRQSHGSLSGKIVDLIRFNRLQYSGDAVKIIQRHRMEFYLFGNPKREKSSETSGGGVS